MPSIREEARINTIPVTHSFSLMPILRILSNERQRNGPGTLLSFVQARSLLGIVLYCLRTDTGAGLGFVGFIRTRTPRFSIWARLAKEG